MKKLIAITLALLCLLGFASCFKTQDKVATLSFRGEHEYFSISKGSILLNGREMVFEGGNLELLRMDLFENVVSSSTTFYTMKDGEKHTILSNSLVDQTGGTARIDGDLGKISGPDLIGQETKSIDNLWFELKTMDLSGKEKSYQLQLTLEE